MRVIPITARAGITGFESPAAEYSQLGISLGVEHPSSTFIGIAQGESMQEDVGIFASNSPHDERPVSYKAIVHFPYPTNCTVELTKAMSEAAPKLFREGIHYYKIGIGLIDLPSEKHNQFDLFNPPKANPALMHTLDDINPTLWQ